MKSLFFLLNSKIAFSELPKVDTKVEFPESKTDRTCKHLSGIWVYLGTQEFGMSTVANFVQDEFHMGQHVDIFE